MRAYRHDDDYVFTDGTVTRLATATMRKLMSARPNRQSPDVCGRSPAPANPFEREYVYSTAYKPDLSWALMFKVEP